MSERRIYMRRAEIGDSKSRVRSLSSGPSYSFTMPRASKRRLILDNLERSIEGLLQVAIPDNKSVTWRALENLVEAISISR